MSLHLKLNSNLHQLEKRSNNPATIWGYYMLSALDAEMRGDRKEMEKLARQAPDGPMDRNRRSDWDAGPLGLV